MTAGPTQTAIAPATTARATTAQTATGADGGDLTRAFRSMATDVTMRVVGPRPGAGAALDRAEQVVRRVATSCTRFDPTSPLMLANARPRRRHDVPRELFDALREAFEAYQDTGGRFDPRVLETLQSWGYDRSLAFRAGEVALETGVGDQARRAPKPPGRRRWRPRFDQNRPAVRLGPVPVDLGGIGKGLAVRWAAQELAGAGTAVLVDAGGDLHATGPGPDGSGWRVAVEDPRGGGDPVAVLTLADLGCATSSVRLRRWTVDGRPVNHLVDPWTGRPADGGLLSVTVVGPDPARAEVWSKVLLLAGRGRVRRLADERGVAALLVDTDGVVGASRLMRLYLTWEADRGW